MGHRAARKHRKLIWFGVVLPLVLVAGAGAAWLAIGVGHGTGTDTTGSSSQNTVTVAVTSKTDAIGPGGTANLPVLITNNSGFPAQISSSPVASVTSTSAGAACPISNFTVPFQPQFQQEVSGTWGPVITAYPITLAVGDSLGSGGPATLASTLAVQMSASAPVGCESISFTVTVSVDGG